MSAVLAQGGPDAHQRIEELGRIIMAYSEVTERLEQSHGKLEQTVRSLRNELSEKNRLLERKNRLAALGEMAAGLAHEIRNPLGGIQLYASLLAEDVADRSGALDLVKKIAGGVRRLEGLVSQVLQFTREITATTAEVDFAEVVDEAAEMAAEALGRRQIELSLEGPRPMVVTVDRLLMSQALLNLLLNAAEAMDRGGRVAVSWRCPETEDAARQLVLRVRDTGPGIPVAILDRIFNPFFTTRETGTGLGLSIVHRVAEAHEGSVTAANAADGGAVFEMRV